MSYQAPKPETHKITRHLTGFHFWKPWPQAPRPVSNYLVIAAWESGCLKGNGWSSPFKGETCDVPEHSLRQTKEEGSSWMKGTEDLSLALVGEANSDERKWNLGQIWAACFVPNILIGQTCFAFVTSTVCIWHCRFFIKYYNFLKVFNIN